jgi:hypothetical protein
MKTRTISLEQIRRLVLGCLAGSTLAALAFLLEGQRISALRGLAGGVGFMATLIGSGVAAWFAARARDARLLRAALFSGGLLAFWAWVAWKILHS